MGVGPYLKKQKEQPLKKLTFKMIKEEYIVRVKGINRKELKKYVYILEAKIKEIDKVYSFRIKEGGFEKEKGKRTK